MQSTFKTVDEYLGQLEPPQRTELQRIRSLIKKEVPEAQELISYQMPAFKLSGKPLIYYAAFKNHFSIFPTPGPITELTQDLKKFQTAKGTIKFSLQDPIPDQLIKKILQTRIKQIKNSAQWSNT